jgi:hypothetical protein
VANRLSISEDNQVLKKVSPEARYQEYKSQWYFHGSWYRRNNGQGSYDGIDVTNLLVVYQNVNFTTVLVC